MGTTRTRTDMGQIETYIQILESRIADRQTDLSNVDKEDFTKRGVIMGVIIGLEGALSTYKILNQR